MNEPVWTCRGKPQCQLLVTTMTAPQLSETYLGKSKLVAATKVRAGVLETRLNLLDERGHGRLDQGVVLGLCGREELEQVALELADERVDKDGNLRAAQRTARGARLGNQVRRVLVGEEVGDDARLDDDVAVVAEGRDLAARVDGEVLGRAGRVEVDDDLLEGDAQLGKGNVCAVGPCDVSAERVAVRWPTEFTICPLGHSKLLTRAAVVGVERELVGGGDGHGGECTFSEKTCRKSGKHGMCCRFFYVSAQSAQFHGIVLGQRLGEAGGGARGPTAWR